MIIKLIPNISILLYTLEGGECNFLFIDSPLPPLFIVVSYLMFKCSLIPNVITIKY